MITIDQMVQREVLCCMSSLVSTLAQGSAYLVHHDSHRSDYCGSDQGIEAVNLMYQAAELVAPVLDYEEAAIQDGWKHTATESDRCMVFTKSDDTLRASTWGELCDLQSLEPYEWEAYEHWAVPTWLAEKLIAQGERVDADFVGLNIWARTTTGQGISSDACIQRIYADMMTPHTLDSVAPGA